MYFLGQLVNLKWVHLGLKALWTSSGSRHKAYIYKLFYHQIGLSIDYLNSNCMSSWYIYLELYQEGDAWRLKSFDINLLKSRTADVQRSRAVTAVIDPKSSL